MKIERERVRETFREYTDAYDATDEKIKLKIDHTYRVAELCERIAKAEQRRRQRLIWHGFLECCTMWEDLNNSGDTGRSAMRIPSIMQRSEQTFCLAECSGKGKV